MLLHVQTDTHKLQLSQIRIDGGTQSRAFLDSETINDYADKMQSGANFPTLIVYYDGQNYWLADGFHRIQAAKKNGMVQVEVEVRQGDQRQAILYSVGANATHGLRRSNDDKNRAVITLLSDPEWFRWSNCQIATHCGVVESFVRLVKNRLSSHDARIDTYAQRYGLDEECLRAVQKQLSESSDRVLGTRNGKSYSLKKPAQPERETTSSINANKKSQHSTRLSNDENTLTLNAAHNTASSKSGEPSETDECNNLATESLNRSRSNGSTPDYVDQDQQPSTQPKGIGIGDELLKREEIPNQVGNSENPDQKVGSDRPVGTSAPNTNIADELQDNCGEESSAISRLSDQALTDESSDTILAKTEDLVEQEGLSCDDVNTVGGNSVSDRALQLNSNSNNSTTISNCENVMLERKTLEQTDQDEVSIIGRDALDKSYDDALLEGGYTKPFEEIKKALDETSQMVSGKPLAILFPLAINGESILVEGEVIKATIKVERAGEAWIGDVPLNYEILNHNNGWSN
jgi:ParB-like nuclease domain